MENNYGSQMRGTRREGFSTAPGGGHLHYSDEDENIGCKNDDQAAYFIKCSRDRNNLLADVRVRVGCSHNSIMLTHKVI